LDLERQVKDAAAIAGHILKDWNTRYDRLPSWAAPGPDGHGRAWGWPDVSDLPEFEGYTGSGLLTRRPCLQMVEAYNRQAEVRAAHDPNSLAKAKAEGRSRLRAWNDRQQEKDALYKELGLDDIDDRLEPHYQRRDDLEYRITETPATSVAGIAVKLRLFARHTDSESGDFVHDFVLSALRDAERLAGRAES
jgi:hypothetical protein